MKTNNANGKMYTIFIGAYIIEILYIQYLKH